MRVAVICDFLEEQWPSMDLVGDMLFEHLQSVPGIDAVRIRPPMKTRFARVSANADRLLNRFYNYPRAVSKLRDFDVFHIVDHSYAQLVHALPAGRVVVTCHDLDTFRSILAPEQEPRPAAFRAMTRRIWNGLSKAAHINCVSQATRDELAAHGIPEQRLTVIPNGVHPSCSPEPDADADREAARLLGEPTPEVIEILHVGSTIPRKRIDVLLRVFAGLRNRFPAIRLVRVGGEFTGEQQELARTLKVQARVVTLPFLSRPVLAAVYRRAALVLQPSEREGFGLPVIEALACGAIIVASDIPVLRETGGEAVVYCDTGNIEEWVECAAQLLKIRQNEPGTWAVRRRMNLRQAARFSWAECARKTAEVYRDVVRV